MVFIKCSRCGSMVRSQISHPAPTCSVQPPPPPGPLTWDVIPHQKLEYAARESSMGATTVLFSAMSRASVSGLRIRLSASTNCKTPNVASAWAIRATWARPWLRTAGAEARVPGAWGTLGSTRGLGSPCASQQTALTQATSRVTIT